jgi:hypothetical protein
MLKYAAAGVSLVLMAGLAFGQIYGGGGGAGGAAKAPTGGFGAFANPLLITLAYGQSRSANYSGANDVCYISWNGTVDNLETASGIKEYMMNNQGAPGANNKADFINSQETALIAYDSCLGLPAGQDLGSEIIYNRQDDVTFSRGNNARIMIAAGEGGQQIANLVQNGPVTAIANAIVYVTDAQAAPITGYIRLTVASATLHGGALNCQVPGAVQPCSQSTVITNGSTQNVINMGASNGCIGAITQAPGGAGVWTVDVIDSTHIDLHGSTYSTAGQGGAACNYTNTVGASSGCVYGVSNTPCCTTFNNANGNPGTPGCGQLGGVVLYNRMKSMVTQACAFATSYGKTCAVDTVLWLQGEADTQTVNSTNISAYQSTLSTLIGNMRTDIAAITSQGSAFEFIMNPPSSTGLGVPLVATIAQYNLGIANGDSHTWMNGPEYQFPNSAVSEHQSPLGVILDGEQFGRTRSLIQQGTITVTNVCSGSAYLCPTSVSNSGATITATFNVPTGCITRDISQWGAATNDGFTFSDDSGATITSVTVSACTQIQIGLSGTPSTNKVLQYATSGPGFSAAPIPPTWGDFRDGRQTPSRYACNVAVLANGTCTMADPNWGFDLSDWMLSFSFSFS